MVYVIPRSIHLFFDSYWEVATASLKSLFTIGGTMDSSSGVARFAAEIIIHISSSYYPRSLNAST